ncbi:MAG: hypothetical protein U5K84_14685 [Alkalibacterium sp.]|nr:hypothetical protein [Alkalibacterium sp.]
MYSFWMKAEQFYTFTMPLIIIVLLLLAVVYVFVLSYADPNKPHRKNITRGFFGLILVSLLYFGWGHATYNRWVEQNEYISRAFGHGKRYWGLRRLRIRALSEHTDGRIH